MCVSMLAVNIDDMGIEVIFINLKIHVFEKTVLFHLLSLQVKTCLSFKVSMLIFLDTNHFSIPCVLSLYFSSSLYFVEFGLIIFTLSLNALRPNHLLPTHQTLNSLSLFFSQL